MIRSRYGLLIALTIITMFGVATGAGLFMAYAPLGDPSSATPEQLFRWLVTRDLSKEPAAVQLAFVHRLDADAGQSGDLAATVAELDDSRRAVLWNNIGVLLSPWLLEKANDYAKLPAANQNAYLDRFLDAIDQWSKIGEACVQGHSAQETKAEGKKNSGSPLSKLIADRVAQCSRHAEPAERKRISTFMSAVQARWVWRNLSKMWLPGKA
jgi:hypothetical protein